MTLLREEKDGILYLDFNSPPLNVLKAETLQDIISVLTPDSRAKVVVFKGSGKMFCAGLDVKDHLPDKVEEMLRLFSKLILAVFEFPGLVVSLVHGGAFGGGCEIAFCSDLLLAEKGADFGQPEIKLGVFPPAACALYPVLLPSKISNHLIFSGESVKAEELERLGIVNRTFEKDVLFERAHQFLLPLTKLSSAAVRLAKKASRVPVSQLKENLENVNRIYLDELMKTEDALEGLTAFLEKRKPNWKNR
jgi:cyclohexa-1,5-dienecarbonyl-CoA hydratase